MTALADTMEYRRASMSSKSSSEAHAYRSDRAMHFTHSPNDNVLDRYTIRRGIGMGGFGEVYFAVSQAGKEVALKRIQRNLEVELRGVSHCLNLKHPNLVSLHDVCRDREEQTWVVMEYVAGPNLREVLDQVAGNQPSTPEPPARWWHASAKRLAGQISLDQTLASGLTLQEALRWFVGTAAGVAHLHAAGLVHRDLKPGNLFDDDGIIKVGDYGLSKFISASHRGGHTESVGTFHYMAPEIGRGQYGLEIDIYAMGVILFEVLTGTVPFDGETPQEIIVKHLTDKPDVSAVASPYREVILRCMEKDPRKRPASIAEMLSLAGITQDRLGVGSSHVSLASVATGVQSKQRAAGQTVLASSPLEQAPIESAQPALETVTFARDARNAHVDPNRNGQHQPADASPHDLNAPAAVTLSSPSVEEPIARAVRNSFEDLRNWWGTLERSPGSRFVIIAATALILLINTHWLLPLVSMVGVFYVPYYVVRHLVLQISEPATYAEANHYASMQRPGPSANAVSPPPVKIPKAQMRAMLRDSLAQRTKLCRTAEWTTSGMTSMVVASALLLISSVIGLRSTSITALTLAPYAWMAGVVWLGSIGLLGVGKAWESSEGEGFLRRIMAALLGAGVGVAAYGLAQFLMVPLDAGLERNIDATSLPVSFYQESGVPKAAAMMGHFALLFGLLRMWKPVDPLRRVRLSLWAVAVAVVGEWVVHQVIPVPQPAGMLIAGGIIVMTQMSAPWVKSDSISSIA